MTIYEVFSLVLSLIAIIISVIALQKSNAFAAGNIELKINERITETKDRVSEIAMQMGPLSSLDERTDQQEREFKGQRLAWRAALENSLNAYEEACAKYLDKKVDRKRFEKNYRTEIRQLVENKTMEEYFDGVTSRYKAILKVYDLWENLEK